MLLCTVNHSFKYELEKLIRIFLPFEKITFSDTKCDAERLAVTTLTHERNRTHLSAYLLIDGKHAEYSQFCNNDTAEYDKDCERQLATALFFCFIKLTGYTPEWGILTGVRPAKLYSRLAASGNNATSYFRKKLFVSDKKISLCALTDRSETEIISRSRPDSFSLYISIPFCPTRCAYCSFVSHSVAGAGKYIPDYVRLLCGEIEETGKIAKNLGLRLETVYIGGGTPTTLTAEQLTAVMDAVKRSFDTGFMSEYTVEAGRPDTIDIEKLEAIKRGGATRISVNPQTLNDDVLSIIGRRHTSAQTLEAYRLARECGLENINMDLIAGLPGDSIDSFRDTVDRISELDPESVTVHSLAMKRAADLSREDAPQTADGETAACMVDYARERLTSAGLLPYYMYRQSKTVGNLENVGYAKKGFEGLYNVYIMDETHTILGCGASAVTKLRMPGGDLIERIFNFKYPYEYISRYDEIIARKTGVTEFYKKNPANKN